MADFVIGLCKFSTRTIKWQIVNIIQKKLNSGEKNTEKTSSENLEEYMASGWISQLREFIPYSRSFAVKSVNCCDFKMQNEA